MALFSIKEATASRLTQFLQLEINPANLRGGELDQWVARELNDADPLWTDYPSAKPDHHSQVEQRLASWRQLAELQGVLSRLSNAIVESEKWDEADTVRLRELYREFRTEPYLFRMRQYGDCYKTEIRMYGGGTVTLGENILKEFISAVDANTLARCPRCAGIFPRTRPQQKHCSRRCTHAEGVRVARLRNK